MFSSRINPDKCFVKVDYSTKAFKSVKPIHSPSDLKRMLLHHCKNDEQRDKINHYFSKHVPPRSFLQYIRPRSISRQQTTVDTYLSCILAALEGRANGIQVTPDHMNAIMMKLTEDIENCREGYLNRLYVIMGSFQQPQSINELLGVYRLQLVDKAYQSFNLPEVHTNHRFYVIANTMGYAIPYEEMNDQYVGVVHDSIIENKLKEVYSFWYTPKKMVEHIWEQAGLELLGYVGKKKGDAGYKIEDYEAILMYFRKILIWPDLNLEKCFILDEETSAVIDINWQNINSRLIKYFEDNGYFYPYQNEIKFVYQSDEESLTYTYGKGSLGEGIIEYKRGQDEMSYQYGIFESKTILQNISDKLKREFDEWVSMRLIEDKSDDILLLEAVMTSDIATVSNLLKFRAPLIGMTQNDENGVLHHAVLKNNPAMITLLIQHGADVTKKNKAGHTAIQLAADYKKWACVDAFAENRSDENGQGNYGGALQRAVAAGELNTVTKLLKAKAELTWRTLDDENGVLHHAVLGDFAEIVALLIEHGADETKINKEGITAFQLAVKNEKRNCMNFFARPSKDIQRPTINHANSLWKQPIIAIGDGAESRPNKRKQC